MWPFKRLWEKHAQFRTNIIPKHIYYTCRINNLYRDFSSTKRGIYEQCSTLSSVHTDPDELDALGEDICVWDGPGEAGSMFLKVGLTLLHIHRATVEPWVFIPSAAFLTVSTKSPNTQNQGVCASEFVKHCELRVKAEQHFSLPILNFLTARSSSWLMASPSFKLSKRQKAYVHAV